MNNEAAAPEKKTGFGWKGFSRVVAMVLGLSLVAAMIPPTLNDSFDFYTDADAAQTETKDIPRVFDPSLIERPAQIRIDPPTSNRPAEYDPYLEAYDRSVTAADEGDYEKALTEADTLLELAETDEEKAVAYALKGNVLFVLEKYDEAEEVYEALLELDPAEYISMLSLYNMLARCRVLQDKLDEALEACNLAYGEATEDVDRAEICAMRGVIYLFGGKYEEAKSEYETALLLGYADQELLETQIKQCEELIEAQRAAEEAANTPAGTDTGTGTGAGTGTGTGTGTQNAGGTTAAASIETNAATHYLAGDYKTAAAEFYSLLGNSKYYTDMQLWSNIAKCYYLAGDYGTAVLSCDEGLKCSGNDERSALYTLRGSANMALGNSTEAAEDFAAAIEHGAEDPELNALQAAICYYFSGDYEKSVQYGAPIADAEGYEEAALWTALSYYMLGDYEKSAVLLEKSTGIEQNYCRKDEIYRLLTRCLLQIGEMEAAVDSANRGLEVALEPDQPDMSIVIELIYLRGSAFLSSGYYEKAYDDFVNAITLGGENDPDILTEATLTAFILNKYSEVELYGERAVALGAETADLDYWIGLAEFSQERFTEASEYLLRCEQLDPERENIWFYIGVCSFSMEDFETAIGQFTKSIENNEPAADRSRYNRAICYLQTEEYEKALEDLNSAAASETDDIAEDARNLLDELMTVLG